METNLFWGEGHPFSALNTSGNNPSRRAIWHAPAYDALCHRTALGKETPEDLYRAMALSCVSPPAHSDDPHGSDLRLREAVWRFLNFLQRDWDEGLFPTPCALALVKQARNMRRLRGEALLSAVERSLEERLASVEKSTLHRLAPQAMQDARTIFLSGNLCKVHEYAAVDPLALSFKGHCRSITNSLWERSTVEKFNALAVQRGLPENSAEQCREVIAVFNDFCSSFWPQPEVWELYDKAALFTPERLVRFWGMRQQYNDQWVISLMDWS